MPSSHPYMKSRAIFGDEGLTLIEILLGVAILALLVIVTIPLFGGIFLKVSLEETSVELIQNLRRARERAKAGFEDNAYGVHFTINPAGIDSYEIFKGSPPGQVIEEKSLARNIEVSTSFPDDTLQFLKGSGKTLVAGTIFLTDPTGASLSIEVNSLGIVR